MKRTKKLGLIAIGAALVIVGSGLWQSRLDYSAGKRLQPLLSTPPTRVDAGATSDLSAVCDQVKKEDGWLIFLVSLNLTSDDTPRTFLQSASEPYGMYIEYDPEEDGLLRLGLGLGPDEWNTAVPLRHVRRNENIELIIGFTADETRVVGNLIDQRANWPAQFLSRWQCDAFVVAGTDQQTSVAINCVACATEASYVTGVSQVEFSNIMNALTNERRYHFFRLLGSLISLVGLGAIALARRRT